MNTPAQASFAPDHVPEELRWDHSLADFSNELDDPFLAVSRLLNGPPVIWARDGAQGRPGWVIARHALLKEAFVDWEHFSSEGGMDLTMLLGVDWNLNPVNIDPPKHTDYRRILYPFFTPAAIGHMEQAVIETCDRLIAEFEDRGSCDYVKEFSIPFPTYIFLSLMGMPIEMAPQFFAWEQDLLHGQTFEVRIKAGKDILAYLESHLAKQKEKPATPLMEAIMTARLEGLPLNDGEILGMFYTFYVGGLDTVYATLSWSMRYIATRPDFQQFLRDNPDRMKDAINELLRMFSVVSTQRRVTKDITFHGVEMKENDLVIMPIFIACRDPEAYPNPHEADIDRKSSIITFGSGPHLCLGKHLAVREIRIALEHFMARFDKIHIPEGETYTFYGGTTFNVNSLPLAWTKIG